MPSKDFYATLGVSKDASDDQIKKSYKKLAFKYHPDRNKGDKKSEEKFKEINEAYQVVGDPEKRSQYDTYGSSGFDGSGFPGGAGGGFPGGGPDLEDLINDFFGQGRSRSQRTSRNTRPKGRDLRYELILEFEQAVAGTEMNVQVRRAKTYKTCNACNGTGQVNFSQGFMTMRQGCGSCGGVGAFPDETENKTVKVKVPPGVDTGTRLRIRNEGDSGVNSGPSGDLYIDLIVKDHPLFLREEENIVCEVPISIPQAVIGGEIDIPTLTGQSQLKIPSGVQPGQVMRLKGKGIKDLHSSRVGDLYVKLNIVIPKTTSSKQKKLMQDFQKEIEKDSSNPFSDYINKVKDFFN
ncbi:molecular chaperone DnaJ [bacterium]|jgi:molecular chaperone DnaJ|nr:molecular chaperone DnaJ [bacterium]MBT3850008.1 molecular chaperone DnaJ [bacterium]